MQYLVGIEKLRLLACIKVLATNPDARKDEEIESVEVAI